MEGRARTTRRPASRRRTEGWTPPGGRWRPLATSSVAGSLWHFARSLLAAARLRRPSRFSGPATSCLLSSAASSPTPTPLPPRAWQSVCRLRRPTTQPSATRPAQREQCADCPLLHVILKRVRSAAGRELRLLRYAVDRRALADAQVAHVSAGWAAVRVASTPAILCAHPGLFSALLGTLDSFGHRIAIGSSSLCSFCLPATF
jgi:hypothetical protein